MAKKQPAEPVEPTAPVPDHDRALMEAVTTDEYAGQGGSFIFDPTTGTRRPADQLPDQET